MSNDPYSLPVSVGKSALLADVAPPPESAGKRVRAALDLPPELAAKRVLTTREAAALLGLSVRDLERKRAAGDMPPAVQLGTRKLGYTLENLLSWIAARTEPQETAA